jgi:hypothetical protein
VDFFISKDDKFTVEVFAYESNGNLEVVETSAEVPENVDAKRLEFVFRKPNHKDVNTICKASLSTSDVEVRIDILKLQDNTLRNLLISWNLTDSEGNPTQVNQESINRMHPSISRPVSLAAMKLGGII